MISRKDSVRATVSAMALTIGLGLSFPALAQTDATQTSAGDGQAVEEAQDEIVVTGFRESLSDALAIKRKETGVVDTITAEDVGKFPDSNLAESMQRLPGVAITRGDGGEGKTISVRGLGAQFTRVKLNGMEGNSSAGSSDIRSGYVSSRSFDFSTFASELFSSLTVRKTMSADIEEGSLGATVDLQTPRPLAAEQDFTLAASAQGTYDDLRRKFSPRVTGLISKKFLDDTFGVAASVAWTKRYTREEGWSAVDVISGRLNRFCSPVGYSDGNPLTNDQSPGTNALNGSNAANCSTGNPRLPNTPTNVANYELLDNTGTFIPRSPRLVRSDQDYSRFGATLTLEARPDDVTRFALDGLFSRYDVTRSDQTITALSFSRNAGQHGSAETSVLEAERDPNGTLLYGRFNGVDLTNDLTYSKYTTTFSQVNLSGSRDFGGFLLDGYVGMSRTIYDKPVRTQIATFANNVNGFSFDFRGDRRFPTIDWGVDVDNPANFVFGPPSADGTVNGTLAMQRSRDESNNLTAELNGTLDLVEGVKFRAGGSYREAEYQRWSRDRVTQNLAPSVPAGTTIAQLTTPIGDFGRSLPVDTISSWAAPDYAKFNAVFNFENQTGAYALNPPQTGSLKETVKGGFAMFDFTGDLFVPVRGNLGVRYVHTTQRGFGAMNGVPTTLTRNYEDWLPSATLTFDLTDKLIFRLAAAKVMTRPELGDLIPGNVSIALNTHTVSAGNFLLNPIRAKTADVSLEYYFGKTGIIAIGGFYKDIDSFIQTRQVQLPFRETGLPLSLLAGSNNNGDTEFTFSTKNNTPGGPLKGVEINIQSGFDFLPGFLSNFGALANFTYADSDISYCNNAACLAPIQAALVNLSKYTANGTLYYEDSKFSIRASGSWRDDFLLRVPSGREGSDVQGNISAFFVDATASYQITPGIQLRLEAQNLTNQELGFYQDSTRQDSLYSTYSGRKFSAGVAVKF
ncbi:TonB-dependent receptor [Sphingomonas sp. DG1-23]|uniref:TonB-dependent receptor n=1 Tax=Sphingomonas sp. DG1-23 TaxID=3068316 RepID=UPI00273DFBAD|nr:TonB-dependent receptor [Sphingomonas sp. DG1-23]MDP5278952.1 TonB-dependent receptor [Sphingomonas sp. DG1-23]